MSRKIISSALAMILVFSGTFFVLSEKAFAEAKNNISEVSIVGIKPPHEGEEPVDKNQIKAESDGDKVEVQKVSWFTKDDSGEKPLVGKFKAGTEYLLRILLEPKKGYSFDKDTKVKINGDKAPESVEIFGTGLLITERFSKIDNPAEDNKVPNENAPNENAPNENAPNENVQNKDKQGAEKLSDAKTMEETKKQDSKENKKQQVVLSNGKASPKTGDETKIFELSFLALVGASLLIIRKMSTHR